MPDSIAAIFSPIVNFTLVRARLGRIFGIDPAELPPLSMSDIVSLIFTLHGDTNSLASAGGTSSAIIALIGRELFWERPTKSEATALTVN